MLENKGRVLEKDEIINAVWKEAKTTMGVTDQALDQLIFRLRKKVEDDPNNPQYFRQLRDGVLDFCLSKNLKNIDY
jgi:DNA-binding winged helix-turn-helix (wHTH) protein